MFLAAQGGNECSVTGPFHHTVASPDLRTVSTLPSYPRIASVYSVVFVPLTGSKSFPDIALPIEAGSTTG